MQFTLDPDPLARPLLPFHVHGTRGIVPHEHGRELGREGVVLQELRDLKRKLGFDVARKAFSVEDFGCHDESVPKWRGGSVDCTGIIWGWRGGTAVGLCGE